LDVPGTTKRRLKRNLVSNSTADLVCMWWTSSGDEQWPWSPMATNIDQANLVLLTVSGTTTIKLEVVTHIRTEGDLLNVCFSFNEPHTILSIEQTQVESDEYMLDSCMYELVENKLDKASTMSIPIEAPVVYQSRSHSEEKILLVCDDGTLVLWDDYKNQTVLYKLAFSPSLLSWHPRDSAIVVASFRGDIQVFDMALNPIDFELRSDLNSKSESGNIKLSQFFL